MNAREPLSVKVETTECAVEGIEIRPAVPADEIQVQSLLRSCELPDADVSDHLRHFVVATDGDCVVGTVGVEDLGSSGLLRSLAVAEKWRDKGLAVQLCATINRHALHLGISELWLLTTTAEGFFTKLRFQVVPRSEAPPEVQATQEFSDLCPDSAVCMRRQI